MREVGPNLDACFATPSRPSIAKSDYPAGCSVPSNEYKLDYIPTFFKCIFLNFFRSAFHADHFSILQDIH